MNDRFKFRVWDKNHNTYIPSNMISTLLYFGHKDEFHIEFECFSTFADSLIIEQCTGLKDKNGNLIYESDYVKDKFGNTFLIKWFNAKFICEDQAEMQPIFSPSQDWLDKCGFEIIGNIHEQAEQKDN